MRIIVFTHPDFLPSQSMPRFAAMIVDGMKVRGHAVDVWTAKPFFYKLPVMSRLKKWLGYLDQFLIFPMQVKLRLKKLPVDTLFIFSDQALGPWVPLVDHRPHVIHVHDFMALRSALGEYVQNPTGWSGKQYQAMIRRGFGHGKSFISVSKNTRNDLERFLPSLPPLSAVVYNGLNFPFRVMTREESIASLSLLDVAIPLSGFLLHVGGNQWYKNRLGILEIYEAYVKQVVTPLPLWMIGSPPTEDMKTVAQLCEPRGTVRFFSDLTNVQVCAAYSLASLMLFPSLAEGFGWPIAEAMACGCLVLTTDEAPMTEVGGEAAFYIPRKPNGSSHDWASSAANSVVIILSLPLADRQRHRELGLRQVMQFDTEQTLNAYENIYRRVVDGGVL